MDLYYETDIETINFLSFYYIEYCPMIDTCQKQRTLEDAGETMKRDTKKAGHRMEEGAEEAKDKID